MAEPNQNDQFTKAAVELAAKLTRESRTLKEEYKELLGIKTKLNDYDKEAINLADKVQQSAKQNVVELGRSGDLTKEMVKDKKLSLDLERELLLSRKTLSEEEQKSANKIFETRNKQLSILEQIDEVTNALVDADEVQLALGKAELANLYNELSVQDQQLDILLESTNLDTQRLALALQTKELQDKNVEGKRKEANIQDQINQKLGIAGNILIGVEEFLGKFAKGFNLEKVTEHMKEFADEAVRSGKEVSSLLS